MKIKVCGMTEEENLKAVLVYKPDFVGFIFYEKSPRNVANRQVLRQQMCQTKKVGVFVNEDITEIIKQTMTYQLDYVQLHGDESPEYCSKLKTSGVRVIKAFSINEGFDFKQVESYTLFVDYFLFDTKGEKRGGNATKFRWSILNSYKSDISFFLSGGITSEDADKIQKLSHRKLYGVDINSGFEISSGIKDTSSVARFIEQLKTRHPNYQVDKNGYYGSFGGAYIPEMLYPNVESLRSQYLEIINEASFRQKFNELLKDYVGRPTPLYKAQRLSDHYQTNIYLKREDLCHTGAHKINNTIGQILLAHRLGKRKIIAETGAGQHGVATATVCALMGLECVVYMGEVDIARQRLNVERMRILGAEVVPAASGSKTLKDATNEAMGHWISHPTDTHYVIGSVVGPHPYPDMVARFHSVISEEVRVQLLEKEGKEVPDHVIACVGGGSNAAGAFYHFLEDDVELTAVEAAGKGLESGKSAATTTLGRAGVLHGSKTLLMQTDDGQIVEPYSISAGLDYPGIGPQHAYLFETRRVVFRNVTDDEAMAAGLLLSRLEGIIPAIESAHALAIFEKMNFGKEAVVVLNLSGRGDKDLETYIRWRSEYPHP